MLHDGRGLNLLESDARRLLPQFDGVNDYFFS